ncbi:MAG TPA: FAD-dependent oxidoreductase [Burkholderiales bacterium]|nr:FAD-dependent oxidoreductase [Burkholderiales bacterium]
MKRLVLCGGGHTHVEVLRRFGLRPVPGVELVLVSPNRFTPYSGMLPGLVAGHYGFDAVHLDLERVTHFAGAEFRQTLVTGFDPRRRVVTLADGATVAFDVASLDVGSRPPTDGIPGAEEHAIGVKPVEPFLRVWDRWLERARAGALARLAVVGGGAAGVEALLSMRHRVGRETGRADAVECHLVTDDDRVLPDHGARAQAIFRRVLAERGVELHLASRVVRVEAGAVHAANGLVVRADAIVWATGAAPLPLLRASGLALDAAGFVAVNDRLQSTSHGHVFAAGDCATIVGHPRPKSGVYAVREGPPLAANLRAALAGRPLVGYVPQKHVLALISTGNRYAVASRGRFAVAGAWVWWWKDWIDRRFVRRYATL